MFQNDLKDIYDSAVDQLKKDPLNESLREKFLKLIDWLKGLGFDVKNMDPNQPSSSSHQSVDPLNDSEELIGNEGNIETIDIEDMDEVRPQTSGAGHQPTRVISSVVDKRVERYIKPGLVCGVSGCGYRSNRRTDLIVHIKRQLKIKDFKCIKCKKGFTTSSDMKRHFGSCRTNNRK